MTLQIRNPRAEILARRLAEMRRTTMTGAVIQALENEIKRGSAQMSFEERNARVMAMADALGASDPAFDMKAYTDEMWGDE
jgi:antitoxin VapB